MAKNLATKNANDFTIDENGEAFISQRKLAELIGVNPNTLMSHIRSTHPNTNTLNGLSAHVFSKTTHYYAYKGYKDAQILADKLSESGAQCYIYTEAGYIIEVKQEPIDPLLMIAQMATDQYNAKQKLLKVEKEVEVITDELNTIKSDTEQLQLSSDAANDRLDGYDYIVANNISEEVIPKKGYYAITRCQVHFAKKFPKSHTRAITSDPDTIEYIRSMQCRRYVKRTLSYENYVTYNINDMDELINYIIDTSEPVIGSSGKVTTKVKSPHYGSSFKHPVE